ncbi:MAG: hypothetical protein WBN65_06415 [Gammaproteobacteria bacterium]
MRVWMVSFLWLMLAVPAAGIAQDEEATPAVAGQTEPKSDDKQPADEMVSGEDVWSGEPEDEKDVFVPSETVSADSAIAFPADI